MGKLPRNVADEFAEAARAFEGKPTGHAQHSDTVVMSQDVLGPLPADIERTSGPKVREAVAEVEPSTGSIFKISAPGTVAQVFLLSDIVATNAWGHDHARLLQDSVEAAEAGSA